MASTEVYIHGFTEPDLYVLEMLCTTAGDLPSVAIFLKKITDALDPAQDAFERIVNIADFDAYPATRVAALVGGLSYYRAAYIRLEYTDVEVGAAVETVARDRLHKLAEDIQVYLSDFETSSTETFPIPGHTTNLEQLETNFYTAYDTYRTDKAAYTAADDAYNAAVALVAPGSAAVQWKTYAQLIYDGLTPRVAFEGANDLASNCGYIVDRIDAYLAGLISSADLLAARNAFETRRAAEYLATNTLLGGQVATNLAAATGEVVARTTDVGTKETDRTTADADRTASWGALFSNPDSAYTQLYAACPNFEPSHGYSWPPVA